MTDAVKIHQAYEALSLIASHSGIWVLTTILPAIRHVNHTKYALDLPTDIIIEPDVM